MPVTPKEKKVRVPGTNRWVTESEAAAMLERIPVAEDAIDEPEPAPIPDAPASLPIVYHAWLPHVRIKRGRSDELRVRGGRFEIHNEQQYQQALSYLRKHVPGRDPMRWVGGNSPRTLQCRECGFFTGNFDVFDDHLQHTHHMEG